jgi:hypothetical protein
MTHPPHDDQRERHKLGVIRGSRYSRLCRHRRETVTLRSVGAWGCNSPGPADHHFVPQVAPRA